MAKKTLLFDCQLCIGCFTCEVACKQEHQVPPGLHWIRIYKDGPRKVGNRLEMNFYARHCGHCVQPACLEACPAGAISQRSDGIVLFDEESCTGCKACIEACPDAVPQFDPEKEVAGACNLCVERLDQGLKPSCVQHCPTNALLLGESDTSRE